MRGNHTRQAEYSQKIKQIAADHISDRHVQMPTANGNDRSDYFRQRSTYGDNGQSNDEFAYPQSRGDGDSPDQQSA